MVTQAIIIPYTILLIFQILHIFEEIAHEIYKYKKFVTLSKYLKVSSVIMAVYLISFMFLVMARDIGTIMGICCSILAMANGTIHVIGYFKIRNYIGTIASGVFSSIPSGITGCISLIFLLPLL
ncbi:MAG: HXXEE domain-containing protein [Promethearchaeota archaeon]